MPKLFAAILGWLARRLLLLLFIVGLLAMGNWMRLEWDKLSRGQERLREQRAMLERLRAEERQMESEIAADDKADRTELSVLETATGMAWAEEAAAKRNWERKEREAGFFGRWFPENQIAIQTAKTEWELKHRAAEWAEAAKQRFADGLGEATLAVLGRKKAKVRDIEVLERAIADNEQAIRSDPPQMVMAAARAQLPAALGLLAGIIVAPFFIKAFLYFAVAPWAARLPPIRIAPGPGEGAEGDAPQPEVATAGVSRAVTLESGEELLVHPDYLQSSALPAAKQTRLFLDRTLPFTSLASGMVLLTRIRPGEGAVTEVVVSAQNDPLGELAIIRLPEGASMVIHPRSLAGVIRREDAPPRITRHWRLDSLHAWLTLQLRFLAFHGPCRLILKGCRGVRAERPDPASPRMVNQRATIGFSAGLDYGNVRCETFVSYLRGKEALFNDLFAGEGTYIYEEVPGAGRGGPKGGRGLEGLLDGLLKVFGI